MRTTCLHTTCTHTQLARRHLSCTRRLGTAVATLAMPNTARGPPTDDTTLASSAHAQAHLEHEQVVRAGRGVFKRRWRLSVLSAPAACRAIQRAHRWWWQGWRPGRSVLWRPTPSTQPRHACRWEPLPAVTLPLGCCSSPGPGTGYTACALLHAMLWHSSAQTRPATLQCVVSRCGDANSVVARKRVGLWQSDASRQETW